MLSLIERLYIMSFTQRSFIGDSTVCGMRYIVMASVVIYVQCIGTCCMHDLFQYFLMI